MRRSLTAAILVLSFALGTAVQARAETIGPLCWHFFVNSGAAPANPPRFALHFQLDPASPTMATVMGVTRFPGSPPVDPPVSGVALLNGTGGDTFVSMSLTVAPSPGQSPQFINVQFLLSDLDGSGYCVGGYGACGEGQSLIWTSISCASF